MRQGDRYACRCCGFRTLSSPPPGTQEICPVCFWEDTPEGTGWDTWGGSNSVELRDAQRNFLAIGASQAEFGDAVRAPLPEEARADGWRTIDDEAAEAKERVTAQIRSAFRGVTREGGVSLHETIAIDDYGDEEARRQQRLKDHDARWEDVLHVDLAEIGGYGGIAFLDLIGWRYYLPAYMIWWLNGGEQSESVSAESLLYSLDVNPDADGPLGPHHRSRIACLNPAQRKATTAFLRYVASFGQEPTHRATAESALRKVWHQFGE